MRSNDLLPGDNTLVLNSSVPRKVELGKLPLGHFSYRFYIYNPSGTPRKLTLAFSGKGWKTEPQTIDIDELGSMHVYNFDTLSAFEYCQVDLSCDAGEDIHLRLPVSPILIQSTEEVSTFLFGLDDQIITRLDELEQDTPSGRSKKQSLFVDNTGLQSANTKDIEAFVHARYFKGFLSVDEAGRQLDFVVFHKMFNTDGDKGFVRLKKKVYRKLLKGVYRLLIKNRSRKMYMAKLYCNYLNMGVLAENLQ